MCCSLVGFSTTCWLACVCDWIVMEVTYYVGFAKMSWKRVATDERCGLIGFGRFCRHALCWCLG